MLTQTHDPPQFFATAGGPCCAAHSSGNPRPLGNSIEMMGAPMPFARNAEIYGENEPAEYLYKVVSGSVRTYKVLNDGRRQIGAFYLPGDMFGLEVGDDAYVLRRSDRRQQGPGHQAQRPGQPGGARQRRSPASSGR